MSISPFFSGKSDTVESLSMTSSLSQAHQNLNVASPNVSPNLTGSSGAGGAGGSGGLALPSMGNENESTNFYHSPNDLFLDGNTVDSFKISSGNGDGGLGMPGDEEQGSLYEFMQGQNSQPPYGLSRSGAPSTSHLFSQAVIGSRILSNQSAAEAKANVAMDYMDMDPKPKYILGPSAKDKATLDDINENEQEHTVLAKKMFEGEGRRDEPIIDAELRAIGIKGIPTIHTACVDGNLRLVRRLTEVRNADIEAKDILGSKPLHVASCYGHLDIITFLLEKGADVNSVDNYDSTPLVVTSDRETVKLLVSFGADINAKNVNSISAKSISLSNPYICLAIEEGQRELRKRILSTKRYIGQIQKHFIRNDLCKHWYADSSNSINRNTSHMSSGSKEMDLDTNVARSGMVSTRKRRREDAKDLGVQSSKSSKKETAVREGYDGSRGSIVVEGPVATSAVPGPPQCIADLIISFLYINAHDSKEELKGD